MKKSFLITAYLRQHLKVITLFLLFALVFAAVFSLYELPAESVLYASALCIFPGLLILAIDFLQFCRHHDDLCKMQKNIAISLEALPRSKGLIEQDYQALLHTLHNEKMKLVSQTDSSRSDMIDYYTLWVHQIKTPIAAMRLLLQSEESSQNAECSMELFKIEQYVEMVLQYLRLDSDTTDYVLKKYSLDPIVRQVVRKYARVFILKKISLDLADIDVMVLTDEKWLVFVIEQLLSNALKYTFKGRISIYTENNTDLVIEDTGIGIQAEDLPRVFEKGYTGYNGRTDKKSTGIGLYLCKRVLGKLGHSISIESQVGIGTRVMLKLGSIDLVTE